MTDDDWYEYLDDIHRAVLKYGEVEFESLVRSAIYRLQRISASGIYGDDFTHKSLWDEWCHEVQEGPHELLEWAWDSTLGPILEGAMDRIPQQARVLILRYAQWELSLNSGQDLRNLSDTESMLQLLRERISSAASIRSIDHLRS